jgi:hypothetical protein
MATFSAHTASPPPPSRTPAGSQASSRHASIAPRTTSARGPLAWLQLYGLFADRNNPLAYHWDLLGGLPQQLGVREVLGVGRVVAGRNGGVRKPSGEATTLRASFQARSFPASARRGRPPSRAGGLISSNPLVEGRVCGVWVSSPHHSTFLQEGAEYSARVLNRTYPSLAMQNSKW